MERASYINPSFEDLARWLISITIFVLLVAPYIYKGQKHTQQLAENVLVSEHSRISNNDQSSEIVRVLIHTTSEQTKLPDEIVKGFGEEIVSSIGFFESTLQMQANSMLDKEISLNKKMVSFGEEIVSSIDFSDSAVQMQPNPMLDQGISLHEEMDGFESVIVSSTNLAKPIPAVQTDLKDDHAGKRSDKNTESKKTSLSRIDLTAPTAPEHLNHDFDLPRLPDGASRVNVSEPLQKEQPQSARGKITSLLHEEKAVRRFDHIIQIAANRYEVDPALVRAIIMAESSYNPKAVSKKGAKGLMQLMPKTAEYLGVEDSFNPEHNIDAGVRYFKQLLKQFNGDVKLALAAYNAGGSRVRKYKGIPPFKDTQYYVKKVFEYHRRFKK